MKHRFSTAAGCSLAVLALAGGCAMGPDYKRPEVAAPDNFRFATSQTTNSLADLPWWQMFQDPYLQDLIRDALTNNYDLKVAVARVEQARNVAVAARAPLFPQIGYSGGVGSGRNALYNAPATLNGATESSAFATRAKRLARDTWPPTKPGAA
jgi:multidrug efflux system outer membrane protein